MVGSLAVLLAAGVEVATDLFGLAAGVEFGFAAVLAMAGLAAGAGWVCCMGAAFAGSFFALMEVVGDTFALVAVLDCANSPMAKNARPRVNAAFFIIIE